MPGAEPARNLSAVITCPACGEQNPERARFCVSCGSALPEKRASSGVERKLVTVETVARDELGRARELGEQLGAEPITSEVDELLEGVPAP
jgi:predicted RNA-binding Zn-ribbon protein involved in translation (DUF1610 family)